MQRPQTRPAGPRCSPCLSTEDTEPEFVGCLLSPHHSHPGGAGLPAS